MMTNHRLKLKFFGGATPVSIIQGSVVKLHVHGLRKSVQV